MNGGGRAIRWSTVGAVTVVALVAAFVSWRHALAVVEARGESGPVGAVVAAWPAPALVISYELLMYVVRSASPAAPEPVPAPPAALNGHGTAAAELFAGDLAAGRVPSIRAIRSGLNVGQDKASQVQAWLRTRV
jgi:hypothetical protein